MQELRQGSASTQKKNMLKEPWGGGTSVQSFLHINAINSTLKHALDMTCLFWGIEDTDGGGVGIPGSTSQFCPSMYPEACCIKFEQST